MWAINQIRVQSVRRAEQCNVHNHVIKYYESELATARRRECDGTGGKQPSNIKWKIIALFSQMTFRGVWSALVSSLEANSHSNKEFSWYVSVAWMNFMLFIAHS